MNKRSAELRPDFFLYTRGAHITRIAPTHGYDNVPRAFLFMLVSLKVGTIRELQPSPNLLIFSNPEEGAGRAEKKTRTAGSCRTGPRCRWCLRRRSCGGWEGRRVRRWYGSEGWFTIDESVNHGQTPRCALYRLSSKAREVERNNEMCDVRLAYS